MTTHVRVPHEELTQEALIALVEDFITREGTDYGPREHSLDEKRDSVMRQVARGEVAIVFDVESESATLVRSDELR
jgi:uncharacterized protein YheU (UPF0270 family)